MRVAYRRDNIKLRNRSLNTKPLVEHLRLLFFNMKMSPVLRRNNDGRMSIQTGHS